MSTFKLTTEWSYSLYNYMYNVGGHYEYLASENWLYNVMETVNNLSVHQAEL